MLHESNSALFKDMGLMDLPSLATEEDKVHFLGPTNEYSD
jgi:hypothetical protein